jgi:hypothetical protein
MRKFYDGYDYTLEDIAKSWRAWNAFATKERLAGNFGSNEPKYLKVWRGFIESDYDKIIAETNV